MSSKSRKHSPLKGQRPKAAAETLAPEDSDHGVPEASAFEVPDELIHVPKETSKLRFILMVLLVIVLLIIFVAPSAFMGVTSSRGADTSGTFATWKLPSGEEVGVDQIAFMNSKRGYDSAFAVHPLLRGRLGVEDRSPSDEDTARLLILDSIALDSGIQVSDEELATELRDAFDLYTNIPQFGGPGNLADYQALANRYGGTRKLEETMRSCMRVERMIGMMGSIAAQPDPGKIEELWNESHADQAFDYVGVSAKGLEDSAREELPDDEALAAWFEALPDEQRRPYMIPEKRAVTFVSFEDFETTPAAGLLAAYPEPEDADPLERADTYYNRAFFLRFRRPEPEETTDEDSVVDESTEDDAEPETPPSPYLSFDEVKDRAMAEAPVYFALQAWNEELKAKSLAGEDVDLGAEANRLGLALRSIEPTSREEMVDLETVGGIATGAVVFQGTAGSFISNVNVLEDVLSIARVDQVVESSVPEFAAVRQEAADQWVTERSAELVDERLSSMRTSFASFTPEVEEGQVPRAGDLRRSSDDEFRAAAAAAGLEVRRMDFADKGARSINEWPDSDTDVARFFFRNRQYREMEVGEVAEPVVDPTLGETILVRLAAERPRSIDAMNPADFERFAQQSQGAVRQQLTTGFDEDYLKEHFGLAFDRPEPEPEEGDGDGEDA